MRAPWFTALVRGPSMVPALKHNDRILVYRSGRAGPGDIVVGRFRSRPDLLVVKRVVRVEGGGEGGQEGGGYWLAGDNPFGSDDSATFGVADVIGRVVLRWWPIRRRSP